MSDGTGPRARPALVVLLLAPVLGEGLSSHRGLVAAAACLLVVPPLLFGRYDVEPLPQLLLAAALVLGLMGLALRLPGHADPPEQLARVRAAGWTAFACTASHFVLTYAVRRPGCRGRPGSRRPSPRSRSAWSCSGAPTD